MAQKKPQRPPSTYRHEQASRPNQPTIETAPLLDDDTRAPKPFIADPAPDKLVGASTAKTDRSQEPQPRLAWDRQGRTSIDDELREFAGTPLYTREKVNPLSMIDQLRKPGAGVPLNLFDDFNGLPANAQKWEFYQHSGHWQNRLIHGDSSQVMQSLIARDGLAGHIQMIYFDPPYGIGFKSNFMSTTRRTDATDIPAGDTLPVKAFRDTYRNGIHSYLDELHERLVLFRELLTESGSVFMQIGDENVHRAAVLLDEVFGADNRVATIPYATAGSSSSKTLPSVADFLLWYSKDKSQLKYRQLYETLTRAEKIEHMSSYAMVELADGNTRTLTPEEREDPDANLPEKARVYRRMRLASPGISTTGRSDTYHWDGHPWPCPSGEHWRVSMEGMDRLAELNRLDAAGPGSQLSWKRYEDEVPGRRITNVWHRQMSTSDKRYVVQTANSVIERCLLMATDPGDLVLDPTCGSGVTGHIAERWGRRWITIDAGRVSIAIARRHLLTAVHPWYHTVDNGSDPSAGLEVNTIQDVSAAKLAYDTVDDPENTIYLVDRPLEDKKRKRLTGPFTVESASPYTYLPFDSDNPDPEDLGIASGEDAERLLEALVGNPICDSDGHAVLEIAEITPWPGGNLVTHEVDCTSPGRQTRVIAAVMLAAPDATVTADQIAAAAAEARHGRRDIADLIIVASAFDNNAPHAAGPLKVHKVVTAQDLQIAALAKEADSGALTLLGEPDVWCEANDEGHLIVTLAGYDTYDPATGNVRSSLGDDVDCWMIDTDHDGTAFFPRLVYLPAYKRSDPNIKNLVKALGKDLDPEAEKALCGLESQPFPPPTPGNVIAIKIITRTGAEMTTMLQHPENSPN